MNKDFLTLINERRETMKDYDFGVDTDFSALSEYIVEARKKKGWSQRDLAERIGVSNSTIARIERMETTEPAFSTLYRIAKVLDCNLFELIGVNYPKFQAEHEEEFQILSTFDSLTHRDKQLICKMAEFLMNESDKPEF